MVFMYFIESLFVCFCLFSQSSHHSSWPGRLCLHQKSSPPHPAGCDTSSGGNHSAGHHCRACLSQPAEPVAPPNASSHAHPVPHVAAGENTGGNCAAEAAAIPTDHQHVGAAAAGTGMTEKTAENISCLKSRQGQIFEEHIWNLISAVAAGVGPTADPAGWRLSATAHQTAASYSDTTDWDILNSGRTGETFTSWFQLISANM